MNAGRARSLLGFTALGLALSCSRRASRDDRGDSGSPAGSGGNSDRDAAVCTHCSDGGPRGAIDGAPDGAHLGPPRDAGERAHDGGRHDAAVANRDASRDGNVPDAANRGSGLSEVLCATLERGPCVTTPGDLGRVLTGTVLTPTAVYRGGQVVLDAAGKIAQVGCASACASGSACAAIAKTATTVTCPSGVISPALINTHDHLGYSQNQPFVDTGERYEQRQDWREGDSGHTKLVAPGRASTDQVSWGELRFVLGGATSTVSSGGVPGLLRNLDSTALEQDVTETIVSATFPLGDTDGTQLATGCGYPNVVAEASLDADDAYLPHVAEGIDAFAENEFNCLGAGDPGHDVLVAKSAFVQAVGLTARDYAAMARAGTSLVWSPRSNLSLYGNTATVTAAARLGVRIALGSDWIPSGSMNLLRELACAASFDQSYLDGAFTDRDLWMMVTANAAGVAGIGTVLGTLAPGMLGDVAIFDGSARDAFDAVVSAEPKDVELVLRSGKVLYGDASIVGAIPDATGCDALAVCGNTKAVCLSTEIGENLAALETAVGNGAYPLFACGAPPNEPTCTPMRSVSVNGSTVYAGTATSTDADGDNIPDNRDDCPLVFNPVRPLDDGVQADADGDGVGDACDPCPLDANTTSCGSDG